MVKTIFRLSQNGVRKLRRTIKLNRYNDFTIAEYFREQGALIGKDNRIEVRSLGADPYLIQIGDHCTIGPDVSFLCHDGATWLFTEEYPSLQKFGSIRILDNCFIGLRAILLGNVIIGPNSIVGAGAVVTRDVPPDTVVAGNPARVVSTVDSYKEKASRIWEEQMPMDYLKGLSKGKKYPPEYIQKMKFKELSLLREHLVRHFFDGFRKL